MIESGVIRHEVEHERDAATLKLPARRIETTPPSHPVVRLIRANAVWRSDDIRVRPVRQHTRVFANQARVGAGYLAAAWTAAPHAHQEHAIEPLLGDAIPPSRRHVGQRDMPSFFAR